MSANELESSLKDYINQLNAITEALNGTSDETEKESLLSLQSDLKQLVQLTQESLDISLKQNIQPENPTQPANEVDEEYALFMAEMAKSGAYEDSSENKQNTGEEEKEDNDDDDIEDDLATIVGMKCAVYHTHKWGGQPSLHNAMVSAVVPRQDDDQFQDLQVRVLFTHPTHTEMLPCPFFLDGECRFSDEQCRFSHGAVVALSNLEDAIEPDFESIRIGSRVLVKLKPPDDEDISLTKKSTEKYHLWHRAQVKSIDLDKKQCVVKLEHGLTPGEKRKPGSDEFPVPFGSLFPLDGDDDSDSDSSISDTEYPEQKVSRFDESGGGGGGQALLIEQSLQGNGPAIGEWERHTRGIGSKLMLSMGYVAGRGLGAAGRGRLLPVGARGGRGRAGVDLCTKEDSEQIENKLKRMQKKEEERNKRAYEREVEREKSNVFNFLNKTLGNKRAEQDSNTPGPSMRQSTSKDLNIEQFKITEEIKRMNKDILKCKDSLMRQTDGTAAHRSINKQLEDKNNELNALKRKEQQIVTEQKQRKDKHKLTVF